MPVIFSYEWLYVCVCCCCIHSTSEIPFLNIIISTHTHTNNTLTYWLEKFKNWKNCLSSESIFNYVNQKCVCMLVCVKIHSVLCYKITINSKSMYVYTKYSMVMKAQHHIYNINICYDET